METMKQIYIHSYQCGPELVETHIPNSQCCAGHWLVIDLHDLVTFDHDLSHDLVIDFHQL